MCHICSIMQRYSNMLWDPSKKTVLGKNGVSWMSIVLGTFVILVIVGIFVHSIIEVKHSRQETSAKMQEKVLEKQLLFESDLFEIKNGTNKSKGILLVGLKLEKISHKMPGLGINNKTVVGLQGNELDAALVLRNKRNTSGSKNETNRETHSSESTKNKVRFIPLGENNRTCITEEKYQQYDDVRVSPVRARSERYDSESQDIIDQKSVFTKYENHKDLSLPLEEKNCRCMEAEEESVIPDAENSEDEEENNFFQTRHLTNLNCLCVKREQDAVVIVQKAKGYKNIKDLFMVRMKRSISTFGNTANYTQNDGGVYVALENQNRTGNDLVTENSHNTLINPTAKDKPFILIKNVRNIVIRSKRQIGFPDFTDRTPFHDYENSDDENPSKRESFPETNAQPAFVASQVVETLKPTGQRTKRQIPNGISNLLTKFSKGTVDSTNQTFKVDSSIQTIKLTKPEQIRGQEVKSNIKIPFVKILTNFASAKLERMQKRTTLVSTVAEVLEQPAGTCQKCAKVKNFNRNTLFDKTEENSTMSPMEVLIRPAVEYTTSFLDKLATAKIARWRKTAPIYTTVIEVFNRSALKQKQAVPEGPN